MKRLLAFVLVLSLLLSGLVLSAVAEEPQTLAASIAPAKDGAKGILTMTFDDGDFNTAVWLDSEFEKYGLSGSCMLIVGRNIADSYNPANGAAKNWQALFAKGRLEPQSHSMTHDVLPSEGWATGSNASTLNNNYPAKYKYELVDSKSVLEQYFPDNYVIAFAASNNTLSSWSYAERGSMVRVEDGGALKVVRENYYAVRQGSRGLQSFNPDTKGDGSGSWRDLYMHRFTDVSDVPSAKKWIDDAIGQGKWLITLSHGITETSGDFNKSQADQFFAYASEKTAAGDLWCADFSTATRYLRERQNSAVVATQTANGFKVNVTMKDATDERLPLTASVFNYPLTVKVEVPATSRSLLAYTCEGQPRYAETFTEGGKTYAYIDVVPNTEANVEYRNIRTQTLSPATALTVVSDAETVGGSLLVSAHADTANSDRATKIYTKISLAGVTQTDNLFFPLTVTAKAKGTVNLYGTFDTSWNTETTLADLPANDPYGYGADLDAVYRNAPLATVKVTGAGDYPVNISDFARAAIAAGKSEITVILTVAPGEGVTEIPVSFSSITEVPGYGITYDFETYDGGLVQAGVETGAIEAVDSSDNHTADGGRSLHLLMTEKYQRTYLKKLLNENNTISAEDFGKEYQVTFFAQVNKAGSILISVANFTSRPGTGDQQKEFTVSESDVGKWVQYSYSFTVRQEMLDGGHNGLFFALRCDSQSPDNPIEGWIDDVVVTSSDGTAKSAAVSLTTGNTLMSNTSLTESGIRKAVAGYENLSGLRSLTLDFTLPETFSGNVDVYLSAEKLLSDATYQTAPAASVGETPDLLKVVGGAPVYTAAKGGNHSFTLSGTAVAELENLSFLFVSGDGKTPMAVTGVTLHASRVTAEEGFTLTIANAPAATTLKGFDILLPAGATFYLSEDGKIYQTGDTISMEKDGTVTALSLRASGEPTISSDKRTAIVSAEFDTVSKQKLTSLGGTLTVSAKADGKNVTVTEKDGIYSATLDLKAGITRSVAFSVQLELGNKTYAGDSVGGPVSVQPDGFTLSFANSDSSEKPGLDVELPNGLFTDGKGNFY
ncbi:MAG: hypothetical protein MJ082_03350, partial [Clostridia bacterium]|nr:hypothetical protein [Clostridia bacterium]